MISSLRLGSSLNLIALETSQTTCNHFNKRYDFHHFVAVICAIILWIINLLKEKLKKKNASKCEILELY